MNTKLPEHLLAVLEKTDLDVPAVLLLRHAHREQIVSSGDVGFKIDFTPFGYKQSYGLGERIGQRLQWAHYSPLLRARHTVEQAISGAEVDEVLSSEDNLLGDPGPFVVDCKKGQELFADFGTEHIVKKLSLGANYAGIRSAQEGAKIIKDHVKELLIKQSGLGLMISHDAIIIPIIAAWTGEDFQNKWLDPLDGALILIDSRGKLMVHRNMQSWEIE
jgi:broad specificity phosphatase PhoE